MESRNTSRAHVPIEETSLDLSDECASPPKGGGDELDVAKYWSYVEAMDLSDDEKTIVLRTLWEIMMTFADLGFGIDPVQQAMPALVHAALAAEADPEAVTRRQFNSVADQQKENDHD